MKEMRVLIESTIPTDGEFPSGWFTLPIDDEEFFERLKVTKDSGDYHIIKKELPFADEVREDTIAGQLNNLHYMFTSLPPDIQAEYSEFM